MIRTSNAFPPISIVVVNYNGRPFLKKCLTSLMNSNYPVDLEIILVDNGSDDDSANFVKKFFPSVKLEESKVNLGYAGGCNRGAKLATFDYIVFMNSDIEVSEKWLEPLVKKCSDPDVAVCGGKILLNNTRNRIYSTGGVVNIFSIPIDRGLQEEDKGQYDALEDMAYVSGAAMMVDRSVFEKLGGFDEDFFAFCEEVDFCFRSRLSGFRVVYVPSSTIFHVFGGTFGKPSASRSFYGFRNMFITLFKVFELRNLIWMLPINLTFRLFESVILTSLGRGNYLFSFKESISSFFLNFRKNLGKRKKIQSNRKVRDLIILKFFLALRFQKCLFRKVIFRCVL